MKTSKGTWHPRWLEELRESGAINWSESQLLVLVNNFTQENGQCWATNRWFGQRLNMRPNSVGNLITRMVEKGMLRRKLIRNSKRYLSLNQGVCDPPYDDGGILDLTDLIEINKGDFELNGFFTEFDKHDTIEMKYQEQAARLFKCLKCNNLLPKKYSPRRWATEIRIVFKRMGSERAQLVFDYLLLNIKANRMPIIRSGKSFKEKFESIELHMKITEEGTPQEKQVDVETEFQDDVKRITKRLKNKQWPKESEQHLESAVALSFMRFEEFKADLLNLQKKADQVITGNGERTRILNLIKQVLLQYASSVHFVESWMLQTHDMIDGWEDWSGSLVSMSFFRTSKRFSRMGVALSIAYCGQGDRWFRLLELLNEGRGK